MVTTAVTVNVSIRKHCSEFPLNPVIGISANVLCEFGATQLVLLHDSGLLSFEKERLSGRWHAGELRQKVGSRPIRLTAHTVARLDVR